jgi:hypothetical protein
MLLQNIFLLHLSLYASPTTQSRLYERERGDATVQRGIGIGSMKLFNPDPVAELHKLKISYSRF